MPPSEQIDVGKILSSLKGFQRRSVDYIFDRLYGENPTRRFLLADEVGLGKTHVARGVIARAIEHLRASGEERIDVVYICSNSDIARQNISRLNVTGKEDFQLASRITMLPQVVHELERNELNFISFTPGTSFNFGHSAGKGEERWLLYWFLRWTWPDLCEGTGAKNVMQGYMSRERFRAWLDGYDPEESFDRHLAECFSERLRGEDSEAVRRGEKTYKERFGELCQQFGWSRKHIPAEERRAQNDFIGEMRELLAVTCIDSLQPDLIILDEFQRFKDLLRPDNPAGELARHLFVWGQARVLLLSATPYKMYTLAHEAESDDHYSDFVGTLRFLIDDDARTEHVKGLLSEYGRACACIDCGGQELLHRVKQAVEQKLRGVMCRTEKLAVTEDRSGMLRDVRHTPTRIKPGHVESYLDMRKVADALKHPDILEYWKASPYLLNFMEGDHYKLKALFRESCSIGEASAVAQVLAGAGSTLLDRRSWQAYEEINPRHALLEDLAGQTVGGDWWRLLWMPPAFPYYQLGGVFAGVEPATMTKRLIFSGWHVVPRAISVMLSYEAERRMMKAFEPDAMNTSEARDRRRPLLTFTRSEGRLTGMPALSLLYPSLTLAELGDSLAIWSSERRDSGLRLDDVLGLVERRVAEKLAPLVSRAPDSGPVDESWYWAAPILLDRAGHRKAAEDWFAEPEELANVWSGEATEEAKGWTDHVSHAAEAACGQFVPTGRPPGDLAAVLALIAVAGPANCALRSIAGALGGTRLRFDKEVRDAAGRIAWAMRSLFNTPEVIALIRSLNAEEPYWRRALEYSAAGCLQGVLDEYLHLVVESENLLAKPPDEAATEAAEWIATVVSMRAATPGLDWVNPDPAGAIQIENQRVRARFAMRFGDERGEREESSVRKDAVRAAFNSPFWPFVLATTSIGQEGLDFHYYCHAVVHWNLPSNPVDLEQREGRVHRFKGHAVRKNVARFARENGFELKKGENLWEHLFSHAAKRTAEDSDITPYWVFTVDGGAVIERHVPTLPLSREAARLPVLRGALAVYRMVFGQPRQDDLVEHLKRSMPEEQLARLSRELSINLEPRT